jgi:acyl-coenzyme A thioesterase PaaI-like protein
MNSSDQPEDAALAAILRSEFTSSEVPGDARLDRLVAAVREVHDSVVGAQAPADVLEDVTELLERAAARLAPNRMRTDAPPSWDDLLRTARTRVLGPPLADLAGDRYQLHATVTFGQFYVGGNGAVHGGAIPLLFDDVLGRLALTGRPMCRTAHLGVDFRRVTPLGRPLRVEARFEREEGRKRFLYGALRDGDELCAEARALFIELRDGAP